MAYTIDEARELVLKAGLELCEAGLVARTWGNISARVSDTQYVITPSGRAYDTLTKEDIVLVNIADGAYEGEVNPSGEKGVHAVVYELRPDMNFVIHTHQNYASALSVLEKDFPVEEKGILGSRIPCAGYGMYATEQLVNNVKEQIRKHEDSKAVLMKYHGALCYGKNYEEAFAVAYELEEESKKIYEKLCEEGSIGAEEGKENCLGNGEITGTISGLKDLLKKRDGIASVLFVQTPFIMKISNLGKTMYPYLDDIAQIAGVDVKCVELQGKEKLAEALQDRNAVFVKGMGAVCTGFDESEAQAVAIVLEKACMAAYLAECVGNVPPLDAESAKIDREGYVNHYSKLK